MQSFQLPDSYTGSASFINVQDKPLKLPKTPPTFPKISKLYLEKCSNARIISWIPKELHLQARRGHHTICASSQFLHAILTQAPVLCLNKVHLRILEIYRWAPAARLFRRPNRAKRNRRRARTPDTRARVSCSATPERRGGIQRCMWPTRRPATGDKEKRALSYAMPNMVRSLARSC